MITKFKIYKYHTLFESFTYHPEKFLNNYKEYFKELFYLSIEHQIIRMLNCFNFNHVYLEIRTLNPYI